MIQEPFVRLVVAGAIAGTLACSSEHASVSAARPGADGNAGAGGRTTSLEGAGGVAARAGAAGGSGTTSVGGAGGYAGYAGYGGAAGDCDHAPGPDLFMPPCDQPAVHEACAGGWCSIPAGCFIMGAPWCDEPRALYAENPVEVTLTHEIVMAAHETTRTEWAARGLPLPTTDPSKNYDTTACDDPNCPVGNVTWFDALSYANKLSAAHNPPLPACYTLVDCKGSVGNALACERAELTAPTLYECRGYRLPTAAEWEYATRAGTTTSFYTGQLTPLAVPQSSDCIPDAAYEKAAWYCANSGNTPHPVGQKVANGWGLVDTLGNVFEWVSDWTDDRGYGKGPLVDPSGTLAVSSNRVIRGGAVNAWPAVGRAFDYDTAEWTGRGPNIGFRLVRTLAKGEVMPASSKMKSRGPIRRRVQEVVP